VGALPPTVFFFLFARAPWRTWQRPWDEESAAVFFVCLPVLAGC